MFTPFAFVQTISTGVVIDPDAQAFIDATGISGTDATAINTLVVDLKANSLYTKFNAIYPMIGGTSTTCKFNLINPADTNAAFRLTFVNTWTFSTDGMNGNGSSAFANTHLQPASSLSLNNSSISLYIRNNPATANNVDMGIGRSPNSIFIAPAFNGTTGNFYAVNDAEVNAGTSPSPLPGFYQVSRIVSTQIKQYRNGSVFNTNNVNSGGLAAFDMYIGAYNAPNIFASDRQFAFASIGEGMSDSEASTFYTIVQAYQTTLGRQV